ncbi:EAL domain-containing protein [Aquisalimonas sp.]|uniref:putative bifunctional diguanylate cyclase/phosphodiesterase n=1 Tax=Aquisalimonas sp. TaxID=1872621 RepID=UPI0025BCD6B7|nr:EAL domain-containing protein [Aquisalimonas sp.]
MAIGTGEGEQRTGKAPRIKILGLMAALVLLAAVAATFNVAVVQMQAAATAYATGNSIWSRAQLSAAHYLDQYAKTGNPAAMERVREWHAIPLGDLNARQAMEAPELDYDTAYEGLRSGRNHPDDIPRMIWLFRYFSQAPYFRDAVEAWQESDPYILELGALADQMEDEWQAANPSPEAIAQLRGRLVEVNGNLQALSADFRMATAEAARWMARVLSVTSIVFLLALCLVAWLLAWRLTRTLTAAERNFRATFEQATVGMAQVGEDGCLLDVNPALCEILGYSKQELVAKRYADLVHPEDRRIGLANREALIAGALDSYTVEKRLLRGDAGTVWGKITVSRTGDDAQSSPRYVLIVEDVSESRRLSAELTYQTNHDTLTNLPNRSAFERKLGESLHEARTEGSVHALCFIDLDQFKIVNDTSGHAAGDDLLRQVARLLHQHLRERDVLARLGGDEFAVILEHCDIDGARKVSEKLRAALASASFTWEDATFSAGCSIGVAPITPDSVDTYSLLRAADIACHVAKEQGRNRVYVLREDDEEFAERHGEMKWLGRIRSALQEERLILDAQRLVCLDEPDRLRYEVLVRLLDTNGEVVPPGAFLPAAERFGAAGQIDRWVIDHVCAQLSAYPEHLAALDACHINLSGRSFDQEDFHDFVVDTLERYALPAEKICFEITETAAVRNLIDVIRFMERLGKRGCRFALDDFGAGLSSFGYLRRLPVDFLKIDGVFVRDIASDTTDLAIVRAINEIGHTLNKTIVAEFVETDAALELLRDMGVHYVQGCGVHSPCRFEELLNASVYADAGSDVADWGKAAVSRGGAAR